MNNKKIVFIFIILISLFSSFLLFNSGITSKLLGTITGINSQDYTYQNSDNYPYIDLVINSTGEKLVNEESSIIVFASSKYKITKFLYSLDKRNYKEFDFSYEDGKYVGKIEFLNTLNSKVYIKVINEKDYNSFVYETIINIDTKIPTINYENISNNYIKILAYDNVELFSIQCSLDGYNYNDYLVKNKSTILTLKNNTCKYIRAVDRAGNISEIKKIED